MGSRRRALASALALALALAAGLGLAADAARAEGPRDDDAPPLRLHQDLARVRANLALLGTPACVFVGYFPADATTDWALDLCYEKDVVAFVGEVTFVRHRRSAVRDLEEDYLRRRGMPRRQAWEGAVVVDAHGEGVGVIEAPVEAARLAKLLREAAARGQPARTSAYEKPGEPRFAFRLGDGAALAHLEPEGPWEVELALAARPGVRVLIRSQRLGPTDPRGERAVVEEIAVERFLRSRSGTEVVEHEVRAPARGVIWAYRLKEAEPRARVRAEALLGVGGDLFVVRLDATAETLAPEGALAVLEGLLPRLDLGPQAP